MKTKYIIGSLLFVLLMIQLAGAEFWACFDKGDRIDYCNPLVRDRSCGASSGCVYCMSEYDENRECYNQGNWMKCNSLEQECGLGESDIDSDPPNMTVNSPEQGSLHTSRSVLLDIELSEEGSIYYLDNINGRGRWRRLSSRGESYSRRRGFRDGFNNITFKATDSQGAMSYVERTFFVDSRDPRISRTEPRRGFADGNFHIQFTEENPEELILFYGNSIRQKAVDLENDCYEYRRRQYCDVSVDLDYFDGQEIGYWFELTDVVGNVDKSREVEVDVDTSFPVVNYINYTIDRRYVEFEISVDDDNFDEVNYIDYSDRSPRERRLCSRLREGICESRKSFREGHHEIDLTIMDEAGNSVSESISFDIDY
jgi:hypothetical protein